MCTLAFFKKISNSFFLLKNMYIFAQIQKLIFGLDTFHLFEGDVFYSSKALITRPFASSTTDVSNEVR